MHELQEAFPLGATKVASQRIPAELLDRLSNLGAIRRGTRRVNFINILGWLSKKQVLAAKPTVGKSPVAQILESLQDTKEAIADLLISEFGVAAFLPMRKMGGKLSITTSYRNGSTLQRWVSVTDQKEHDIANWHETAVRTREGSFNMVLVTDLYAATGNRTRSVRIWLPALNIPVTFTERPASAVNPQAKRRGGFREMRSFPLTDLWQALGVGPKAG